MDRRRRILHASVAAGGAAAALMSTGVVGSDEEVLAAAGHALEPVLRAALLLIEAGDVLPGELERGRLKMAIQDYIEAPSPRPGRCRVCGCTESNACIGVTSDRLGKRNCAWADSSRTLCDSPACLEAAKAAEPAAEVRQ